jgi:hypothetical protein
VALPCSVSRHNNIANILAQELRPFSRVVLSDARTWNRHLDRLPLIGQENCVDQTKEWTNWR